jgi:predicted nucleotidyltransferase component of viral defense system
MGSFDSGDLHAHEDPELFREAVIFTAARTGFPPRLIEKDYFRSVLMAFLAQADGSLVLKGGTCLAKVHAGFFRLSEDLDWIISVPVDATRSRRSSMASGAKKAVASLSGHVEGFSLEQPLTGANLSTQYIGIVAFRAILTGEAEPIKIEVSLREPLLRPAVMGRARTLLLDPISGEEMVPAVRVPCISSEEAYAEKLRAALTRREAAIRDFFDVDHAFREKRLKADDPDLISMVRRKLAVAGNDPIDVSRSRLESLRRQVDARLKPVLRPEDYERFDLERAFGAVSRIAELLGDTT